MSPNCYTNHGDKSRVTIYCLQHKTRKNDIESLIFHPTDIVEIEVSIGRFKTF